MRYILLFIIITYAKSYGQDFNLTGEEISKFTKFENNKLEFGRIYKYEYSKKEMISRESIFEKDSTWRQVWDMKYYYDQNDSLHKKVLTFTLPDLKNKQTTETEYYHKNRRNYTIDKFDDGNGIKIDTTYFRKQLDSLGNIISKSKVSINTKKKRIGDSETIIYEYDLDGNVARETIVRRFELSSIFKHKYNSSKQVIESEVLDNTFGNSIIEYKYNEQKLLAEKITTNFHPKRNIEKIVYRYNLTNQLIEETYYENDLFLHSYLTEYDKKNRKTKYYQKMSDGTISVWLYFYNDNNNKLLYKLDLYNREN